MSDDVRPGVQRPVSDAMTDVVEQVARAAGRLGIVALIGSLVASPAPAVAQPPSPPTLGAPVDRVASVADADPGALFAQASDRLLQVRTLLRGGTIDVAHGSGFVVDVAGKAVTSYHVVAQAALEPARYALEWVMPSGRRGAARVVAVDVVRDLALLRFDEPAPAAYRLQAPDDRPRRGERVYALGHPLDVGFAVTEGRYNGLTERALRPQMHFGGAVNAGMSGGPVVSSDGRVVGVLIERPLRSEALGLLAPVDAIRRLLADANPASAPLGRETIVRQLRDYQRAAIGTLPDAASAGQRLSGYRVPVPDTLGHCHNDRSRPDSGALQTELIVCDFDTAVSIGPRTRLGAIRIEWQVLESAGRGDWSLGMDLSAPPRWPVWRMPIGSRRAVPDDDTATSPVRCTTAFVAHGVGEFRNRFCAASYRHWPGLHRLRFTMIGLPRDGRVLIGSLQADGVEWETGQRLIRWMLDGLASGADAAREPIASVSRVGSASVSAGGSASLSVSGSASR